MNDDNARLDGIAEEIVRNVLDALVTAASAGITPDDHAKMLAHHTGVVCQAQHDRGRLQENEIQSVVDRVEFRLSKLDQEYARPRP